MFGYTNPPQPTTGRWVMVNSFSEIQNALVPIDGTQTLFMLTNEPIFYIVTMVNGQKMLQGYTFTALTQENAPAPAATMEDRMTNVEACLVKMTQLLERGMNNESDIQQHGTEPAARSVTEPNEHKKS